MEILPVLISNTTAVGDMGDLEKDQTCDNWKSKAIQVYGFDEKHPKLNDFTTTGAEISTANHEVKTAGDSIKDIAVETFVYIRRSAAKAKDKGKAKMEEFESAMTKTKRKLVSYVYDNEMNAMIN
ncbi:hypothetical protein Tco_0099072 [Tanacetum coccineum]